MPVEAENIFDGPEVAGFVVVSGGIFDVVKVEFVLTGGCDGRAGVGTSALEATVTVASGVFLPTERLDAVVTRESYRGNASIEGENTVLSCEFQPLVSQFLKTFYGALSLTRSFSSVAWLVWHAGFS